MDEIQSNELEAYSINNSSLKRIGNFIKEARISRNQSVEELASELKIGAHQLQAIEEGNEDLLPEKVFIKAMVRRISEKLKIDTGYKAPNATPVAVPNVRRFINCLRPMDGTSLELN